MQFIDSREIFLPKFQVSHIRKDFSTVVENTTGKRSFRQKIIALYNIQISIKLLRKSTVTCNDVQCLM